MRDLLESLLICLVITVIIIVPTIIWAEHEHKNDINTYNNGICECGGHYEFINKTHIYMDRGEYVFQCDTCNKIVEFKTNPIE